MEAFGGVSGYEELVRAATRPRHSEHAAMVRWYSGPYYPDNTSKGEIIAGLAELARRRTLGKAAYLKSVGLRN